LSYSETVVKKQCPQGHRRAVQACSEVLRVLQGHENLNPGWTEVFYLLPLLGTAPSSLQC